MGILLSSGIKTSITLNCPIFEFLHVDEKHICIWNSLRTVKKCPHYKGLRKRKRMIRKIHNIWAKWFHFLNFKTQTSVILLLLVAAVDVKSPPVTRRTFEQAALDPPMTSYQRSKAVIKKKTTTGSGRPHLSLWFIAETSTHLNSIRVCVRGCARPTQANSERAKYHLF